MLSKYMIKRTDTVLKGWKYKSPLNKKQSGKIIPFDISFHSENKKLDHFMRKAILHDDLTENRRLRNQREREERMMNDFG
jgi:hypothetical protein